VVAVLAKLSGKTAADVRGLKQSGVTWSQVASDLGVNWAAALPQIGARFRAQQTARLRTAVIVQTLAKLSGKTAADVRGLKKPGVTWSQVASDLGVNWSAALPQIGARFQARQTARLRTAVTAQTLAKLSGKTAADVRGLKKPGVKWTQVASELGVAWAKASPLIRQRVTALTDARIRTAAVVGLLAKLSGKTPAEVRGLKKPGVTWVDVAHSLGIQ
jgi:sulfur transfer protein SufE